MGLAKTWFVLEHTSWVGSNSGRVIVGLETDSCSSVVDGRGEAIRCRSRHSGCYRAHCFRGACE